MSFIGPVQTILGDSEILLSEDEWEVGLSHLCPYEKPALKRPEVVKPLSVLFYTTEEPLDINAVWNENLGKGFREVQQLMAHLILLSKYGNKAHPFEADKFIFFRLLCGFKWQPFSICIDNGHFGVACHHQVGETTEAGDVFLFAS